MRVLIVDDEADFKKRAKDLGASAYFVKPVIPPKLIEEIETWGRKRS